MTGDGIAIIGAGLRFPGGSTTLDGLDAFLSAGSSGIGPLPHDRWEVDAFDGITTTAGGFLDRIDEFDAPFFNIAPKQAVYVDPQQRLLLETAWEALESANLDPTATRHSNSGVYIGATPFDFALELEAVPYAELDGQLATGMGAYALSGRLSYFLGWRGPSLTTDTACASSLTALHLAVQGLRHGECDLALCGGVNALHHPRIFTILSAGQVLAPDGRCKAFDDAADGYARAEGCGVVVLKRLPDAQRDGDRVLAVIRGTAIGQDGESAGLTAPNGAAQEAIMRAALTDAGVSPAEVSYVEAHGTGTPLGDPIELGSINGVFATPGRRPIVVGSLKSNIGHMEPAAGIGGLIKTVLQLDRRTIYPHRYETLSKRIPWDAYPIAIPSTCEPWQSDGEPRRATVNSFGLAGAIGVAVLEEAPPSVNGHEKSPAGGDHVFTLSAKSQAALALQVNRYKEFLAEHPGVGIADLCYTRNVGRAHFPHRLATVAHDTGSLGAWLQRQPAPDSGVAYRKVALLFTGSGAQHPGMGRELYEQFPLFRRMVDECDTLLRPHLGRSVRDLMFDPRPMEILNTTLHTHSALFTFEYSLAKLWMSFGVRPNVLIGHSVGEIIAAAVAGLFSLEDGIDFLVTRAKLIESIAVPGGMFAVKAPAAQIAPLLSGWPDLSIAAINSPRQTVVSGAKEPLDKFAAELSSDGLSVTALQVSTGFHSPLMAGITERLAEALRRIRFKEPSLTLISNLTGAVAMPRDLATAEYWVKHLCEPVDFAAGIQTISGRGKHLMLEVGPSSALTALARQSAPEEGHRWVGGGGDVHRAVAQVYTAGLNISWPRYHEGRAGRRIALPGYVFDHKRYWLPIHGPRHGLGAASPQSPLGVRAAHADGVTEFRSQLSSASFGYLKDHRMRGRAFVPAAFYLEMFLEVSDAIHGETSRPIEDVCFTEALYVGEEPVDVRTRAIERPDGTVWVEIVSRYGDVERLHATATISAYPGLTLSDRGTDLRYRVNHPGTAEDTLTPEQVYAAYAQMGLDYGPGLRRVRTMSRHTGELALSELDVPDATSPQHMSPPILDSATHGMAALAAGQNLMGVGIGSARIFRKPRAHTLRAAMAVAEPGSADFAVDVLLLQDDEVVAEIIGLSFTRLSTPQARPAARDSRPKPTPKKLAPHEAIRSAVAQLLQLDDPTAIGPGTTFLELGLDSLGADELRATLEQEFGVKLEATAAFDHPTLESLADHVDSRREATS
ncbi:type I polyketide synthase [Allorhizocola rhizosphaerae]|uniref:type I polyketide synthase n=1 Tax=Allorhizocola rhizosphaerae TaxID=1872709 RepID=UPI000E3DE594|nr:type I polyketide synthase [Allorhizocola rhizosphaerae]